MMCGGRETPASDLEIFYFEDDILFWLFFGQRRLFITTTFWTQGTFLAQHPLIFINKWDNFGCVKGSVGMMCGGINISASDSETTFHFSYFLD